MIIGCMGAGGTGKTTTAKALCAALNLPFIPSSSRGVFERWGIDETAQRTVSIERQYELQQDIFAARKALELTITTGVADRTLLDQCTYNLLRAHPLIDEPKMEQMIADAIESLRKYHAIFYFPLVTYPTGADGMRDTSYGSRLVFDAILQRLISRVIALRGMPDIIPVPDDGTVAQRMNFILLHLPSKG